MVAKRAVASTFIGLLTLILSIPLGVGHAQNTDSCQAVLVRALDTIQASCDSLGRNRACYGSNNIQVEPSGAAPVKFDTIGDRVAIQSIRTLVTSPLDVLAGTWGLSLLKLQANLPDTLPGQNVTFLVFGDTSLENASGDMKAFYFTTGLGNLNCKEAPDAGILVRSPSHTEITFNANGVDITIASTIMMRAERNQSMTVHLIEGHARLTTAQGTQTLSPGQAATVPMGGPNGLTAAGAPSAPFSVDDGPSTAPVIKVADDMGDPDAPVNISIEGCVSAVNGNSIVVDDYTVNVGSDPTLKSAKVGDCLKITGALKVNNDNGVDFVLGNAVARGKPEDPGAAGADHRNPGNQGGNANAGAGSANAGGANANAGGANANANAGGANANSGNSGNSGGGGGGGKK